jgi:hypothetical protein
MDFLKTDSCFLKNNFKNDRHIINNRSITYFNVHFLKTAGVIGVVIFLIELRM